MKSHLAVDFGSVDARGSDRGAFLFIEHRGRAIELSEANGRWWIEFWDRANEFPVREQYVDSDDVAIRAIKEWLIQLE
jgi:hypothetical protein